MFRRLIMFLACALPVAAAAQSQFNPDYQGRLQANEADCRNGVAEACRRLGGWYGMGGMQVLGVRDPAKSAAWYERGCALGDAASCGSLGSLYGAETDAFTGERNALRDPARARTFHQKACDAGHDNSCQAIARERAAEALVQYEAACAAGDAATCLGLAQAYFEGRQVPHDMARALSSGERACTLGAAHGCMFIGAMHEQGKGVPRDAAKAETYFRRALALAGDNPEVRAYLRERGVGD